MMRRATVRRTLALVVLVASWAPAIASVLIAWAFELRDLPVEGVFLSASPAIVQSRFDDIGVVVALIYGPLSALLIARRPHPVAGILAVHSIGSGIAALGVQWGLLGFAVPGLPLWGFLAHAAGWGYIPGTIMTTIIPLLLIGAITPLYRALIAIAVACATVGFVAAFTQQSVGGPLNPFAIPDAAYQEQLPGIYGIVVVIAVSVSTVTAVIILRRWLSLGREQRRGLGWLVTGHIFLTLSYGALILPDLDGVPGWVWDFGMIAPVVGQVFYPAAILVIVLGSRVRGIDVAVNRVLLWAILVVIAVSGYLVLVSVLNSILDGEPYAVGIAAALIVALGIQPLRSWLQVRVDRLVYSSGAGPTELIRTLGERVGDLESGSEGLRELADALRNAYRLGSVSIRSVGEDEALTVVGRPVGTVTQIELRAGSSHLGWIDVTPRRGDRVSGRVVRALEELSGVVAAAVQLARANEELERARDDVLAVRQEERRVIRRELHDGIGPALAGIGFGLAGVSNLVETSPDKARSLLERLTDDLRSRLTSVRSIVRAMDTVGDHPDLAARLRALAEDFSGAGVTITVDAPAASHLTALQREAAYFIAAESVHNAVRHGDARTISIDIATQLDRTICLAIADDGRGFEHTESPGLGLTSMRERANAVDARLTVDSEPGVGTTIIVGFGRAGA
ncbi:signal transduction histidine kinase [Microbacteriaceae bacterium SG_E_30_P1]|uniref:histidine kinase n=1 Tax=Antiquaquibacter oligotrophicus TaxID=2880260 RepID=A0ABT6KLB7_9MICO|nr:histidine kinase [Antiquaquibacter oligotrophicus]MDH6179979.1 signal transduction histidine kinase [Antiquaquibacter oligotrophicus]UDF14264.1 histidine kinase [Antiquaquibacter oligotrophicus]